MRIGDTYIAVGPECCPKCHGFMVLDWLAETEELFSECINCNRTIYWHGLTKHHLKDAVKN